MMTIANATEPNKFPETHWPSVLAAGDTGTEAGLKAMGDLLTTYRTVLRSYLEKKFFYNSEQAEDLLQDFILQIVIEKKLFSKACPLKGHQFRTFLLCSLHAFAVSHHRRRTALKRQPVTGLDSLDEMLENDVPMAQTAPSNEFDIEWARAVLTEALRRMHEECKRKERLDIWGVFDNRVRKPLLEGQEMQSYAELVREFRFASPAQAHNVLITGKRTYARFLEEVVSEYVSSENSIPEEIRELQMILSHAA